MEQKILDHWDKYFMSDECKKDLEEYFLKIENKEKVLKNQYKRIHKKYSNQLSYIIDKIIFKYESDIYKDRWYNRGFEPEEYLYWILFGYASVYGKKANKKHILKYGNMFTSEAYIVENYFIQQMNGQGQVVQITKI